MVLEGEEAAGNSRCEPRFLGPHESLDFRFHGHEMMSPEEFPPLFLPSLLSCHSLPHLLHPLVFQSP